MSSRAMTLALPRLRGREMRSRRLTLLAVMLGGGLLIGGWLWLRDSSLVAVTQVRVVGVGGRDAGRIRAALGDAARSMTTLHVRSDALRAAVSPYPVVKDVKVSTSFPHRMTIRVIEELPVAAVVVGGVRVAVAGDGTLLRDVTIPSSLPSIPLALPPGGTHVRGGVAGSALSLLDAAPGPLRARVLRVFSTRAHGLTALLRLGPAIWFGDPTRLAAKWGAAAQVLADPSAAGASYVDVWVPERPAAGGLSAGATTAAAGSAGAAGTGSAGPTVGG